MSKLFVLGAVLVVALAVGQLEAAEVSKKSLELLEEMQSLNKGPVNMPHKAKEVLMAMYERRKASGLGSLGADILQACEEVWNGLEGEAKKFPGGRGVCYEFFGSEFDDEMVDIVSYVDGRATRSALREIQNDFNNAYKEGKSIEESLDRTLELQVAKDGVYLGSHTGEVIATWFVTGCKKFTAQSSFVTPMLLSGFKLADDKRIKFGGHTELCQLVNKLGKRGIEKKCDAMYEQVKQDPTFAEKRKKTKEDRAVWTKGMGIFEKMGSDLTDGGLAKDFIKETKEFN